MIAKKYTKLGEIDHIIKRPETYIGSVVLKQRDEFVVIDENFNIDKRSVEISDGIVRIFLEIVSNATDNVFRSRENKLNPSKIEIDIDAEGLTSVWNDGDFIPIEMHEEGCYNHSLIFGQLRTGSNYDDNIDRSLAGLNGLGGKLTNVFSTIFQVQGGDPNKKKEFSQMWTKNMRDMGKETIKAYSGKAYTKITYKPDFSLFGLKNYTPDILAVYKKYLVDFSMNANIPIYFNGQQIPCSNIIEYSKLYNQREDFIHIETKDCNVVFKPSDDFYTISFVNCIPTYLGGTHVDPWIEAFLRPIMQKLNKEGKPQISLVEIKKHFCLFVSATINKPRFESQSKQRLEQPIVVADVKTKHITAIMKWSVIEDLKDLIQAKEMVVLKKVERKKKGFVKIDGLQSANFEGTNRSTDCTLFLVEGDSAASYALNGIEYGVFGKVGRDYNGIYALRGKLLNTRNANSKSMANNAVISDIIKAIGLEHGTDYLNDENYKKLRYGRIMILTDADLDGIHISSLIQNIFHSLFPTLLKRDPPFITGMQTHIVRVRNGLGKGNDLLFYDEQEYYKWLEQNQGKKIDKKYYKGLGTSEPEDIADTFGQKIIYFRDDDNSIDMMNKAFGNKFSDQRKEWLEKYDPNKVVLKWSGNTKEEFDITVSQYIDTEWIKYSIGNCKRSIPNMIDGLKEGHRKVLYVTLLSNLKYSGKSIKVAQLANKVAEKSNYHHGEENLNETITGMACDFVGSNNIPLLQPEGCFGTREQGGKDAAAARYIFTKLNRLTRLIYRVEDESLLEQLEDDGDRIEPKYYVPIIPMILVNGSVGIGTGWSTSIPCYNPIDIVNSIKIWINCGGKVFTQSDNMRMCELPEMVPWYRGYSGKIITKNEKTYLSTGTLERVKNKIHITELPVGVWTGKYRDFLKELCEDKNISSYIEHSTTTKVDFLITENKDGFVCNENNLKLFKSISISNMVALDENNKIHHYSCTEEIIDAFCQVRLSYYIKRKEYQLKDLQKQLKLLNNKIRFLQEIRDGDILLFNEEGGKRQSRSTEDFCRQLIERKYEPADEDEDNFGYLLRLQINTITTEKINKLIDDRDSLVEEHSNLSNLQPTQIWISELDELVQEYELWLKDIADKENKLARRKKGKK